MTHIKRQKLISLTLVRGYTQFFNLDPRPLSWRN